MGVNVDEIAAIKYLTFYSSWNEREEEVKRFLTLRYELPLGPWLLTISGDDTKFALSHLCDRLGKRIEVCKCGRLCFAFLVLRVYLLSTLFLLTFLNGGGGGGGGGGDVAAAAAARIDSAGI